MVSFNSFSGAPFCVMIWVVLMETENHIKMPDYSPTPDSCWTGWSESPHLFYLIAAPMLVAYVVSKQIANVQVQLN